MTELNYGEKSIFSIKIPVHYRHLRGKEESGVYWALAKLFHPRLAAIFYIFPYHPHIIDELIVCIA